MLRIEVRVQQAHGDRLDAGLAKPSRDGTGVVQELLAVRRGHLLGEDLQTVAIGVEEVDALGEDVVSGEFYLGAVALEPLIELPQLLLTSLDL